MSTPASAVDGLAITLFGPMQVRVQGLLLPPLRSRKALWALALLTLRHERPVEREWLAATLWPDLEQSQAFANLRPVLSELRKALGEEGARLRSPDRQTLLLELAGADVDVLAFDAAIKKGNLADLKQAVALYGGSLLEGCTEEWVHQERAAREQKCLQALLKLGEIALNTPDYAAAIGYYQKAAGLDAWSDVARRGWMEALAKQGDRNAALQVYREFLNILSSDPNAVPDKQTRALYERLRAEARQKARAPAAEKAEVAALPRITGYLPHALTDLVGREDERLEVAECLRRSRLVTLTGMGGIGKTRLAMEVAKEVLQEYADGVWLVALEALSEDKMVAQQIASVLGLKEESGRSLLQSLKETLRGKRLLLVLDNCEHLLEASAQAAAYLLRECAGVHILATSREALGITSETAWAVPYLATPNPAHLPQAWSTLRRVLMGYESVQLFAERAQAVHKTFALTSSNALSVAQVCFRLEGIPLAIELAAARIKALTVEQIAARLDDELGLLTGGNRTAQSRQQTLRSTLDWSYHLLNNQEKILLRRLSVFAGGWTLDAAESVCTGEDIQASQILNLLTSLIDKSLIAFVEREGDEGGRYHLLEMVRQYATERLSDSSQTAEIKARHRDWCVALTEAAEPQLRGARQEDWLKRLETEHGNLREALNYCEADSLGAEAGLRLCGALWRFWYVNSDFKEGRRYYQRALDRAEAQAQTAARAKALNGAGTLAYDQGEYAAANALFLESLNIRRDLGDQRGVALALNNLGNVAHDQCHYASAQALYEESLQIQKELGDKSGIALVLGNLGNVARPRGDLPLARALYEESLKLYRELGDRRNIPLTLERVGLVAYAQGDYTSAWALHEESLSLRREFGNRRAIAWSLCNLGEVAHVQGNHSEAQYLFEESLTIFKEFGDRRGVAASLGNLGSVSHYMGEYSVARGLLHESVKIFRELEDQRSTAQTLTKLGNVAYTQGEYNSSRLLHEESLGICALLEDRKGVTENLEGLASVMLAQAQARKAVRLWGATNALRAKLGIPQPTIERARIDKQMRETRLAINEDAFASDWAMGLALTWEQAVAYALSEGDVSTI